MMRKKLKVKVAAALAVSMMAVSMAGCADSGAEEGGGGDSQTGGEAYVIGVDCPMTGVNASFGEQLSYGAQMAVDEINEAGGIDGKKLKLSIQDDKSDPKEAATIATKFVADESIIASIGYYNSSCGLSALPIINVM